MGLGIGYDSTIQSCFGERLRRSSPFPVGLPLNDALIIAHPRRSRDLSRIHRLTVFAHLTFIFICFPFRSIQGGQNRPGHNPIPLRGIAPDKAHSSFPGQILTVGLRRAEPLEPGLNPPLIQRTKQPAKSTYIVLECWESSTLLSTSLTYCLKSARTCSNVSLDGDTIGKSSSARGIETAFFRRQLTLSGGMKAILQGRLHLIYSVGKIPDTK